MGGKSSGRQCSKGAVKINSLSMDDHQVKAGNTLLVKCKFCLKNSEDVHSPMVLRRKFAHTK